MVISQEPGENEKSLMIDYIVYFILGERLAKGLLNCIGSIFPSSTY